LAKGFPFSPDKPVATPINIEKTIRAFETTLKRLKGEGVLD